MAIHKSGEDYLEAILILQKKNNVVKSTDVASFLNYSRPSVCNAVDILERDGFITMNEKKHLELTTKGLEVAEKTYEKHVFLVDLFKRIGVDAETAEKEGCLIEHIISANTFDCIKRAVETLTLTESNLNR